MKKQSTFIFSTMLVATLLSPMTVYAVVDSKAPLMMQAKDQVATSPTEVKEGAVMEKKSEYALPYPGILSDHPLYFLKKLRDQILERLISDPTQKVKFYVLQSDKALNAGIFLNVKGKQELTTESFASAGVSMDNGIKMAQSIKAQGREIPAYVVELLGNSLAKHEEVLNEVLQASGDSQKANVGSALEIARKQQVVVGGLK